MESLKGALTIAEGDYKYKTDVSLALGGSGIDKKYVLRTSFDQLGVWKAKYVKQNISPFDAQIKTIMKAAAIIEKEVWVFGVDSTQAQDIVVAVEIAMRYYNVSADKIINDIYVKNLNTEQENSQGTQALITANKKLYSGVCSALTEAAKLLNVKGSLNLWIISSNVNPKIPKDDLYESLKAGGASSISTDPQQYSYISGSNDGEARAKFKTNLHLATLLV